MGYSYESFLERDRHPYVLVVGGSPERLPSTGVQHLARICDRVVAVDGGLDSILDGDITADVFCGDADSVGERSARCVSRAELGEASRVRSVERYDPYKDFTDLALALRAIDMRWGDVPLLCTGLSGGRTDHCLAAVGRLVSWAVRSLGRSRGSRPDLCTLVTFGTSLIVRGRPFHLSACLRRPRSQKREWNGHSTIKRCICSMTLGYRMCYTGARACHVIVVRLWRLSSGHPLYSRPCWPGFT